MHEISSSNKNLSVEAIGTMVAYDKQDKKTLKEIYNTWTELNEQIGILQGRRVMVPEELIEGIVCSHCEMWKVTNSVARGFDLWDPNAEEGKNRVHVYATTGNAFHILFPQRLVDSLDRILLVKLYVSKDEPLKYEIYDFDIKQIINYGHLSHIGRVVLKFDELEKIPYNKKYTGEL